MKAQVTTKNGERWSTDRIIYENSNVYDKLTTAKHSLVQKVCMKYCLIMQILNSHHSRFYSN